MNPGITTQFGNPDPNASPLNITQLVQLLNALVSSQMQGSYVPYVLQQATPNVEDQDKAWIVLDSSGRPIAIKIYYSGNWRRVYNGMIGEVRMYNGDPTVDFDGNGLGLVGGTYDGWHLCNGQDGTPDLSDNFLVAGHMNNSGGNNGYDSGWQSTVLASGIAKTGGANTITLDAATTYTPARDAITARRFHADGNAPDATGDLLGLGDTATQQQLVGGAAYAGNTSPTAISIVPPFIAIGYIIFIGY